MLMEYKASTHTA